MKNRPLRTGVALAAICAVAAIAYAPSFGVPFQFDDYARLGENQGLRDGRLFDALIWLGNSRLVPSLTLVLNYRLGAFDPVGYHVGNFAVHLLTSFGVFALALALCRTPRLRAAWPPERALLFASAAALVFACHPLQTQAVTYVIQRFASMAALFYVWSVVCYLRGRARRAGLEPGRPAPFFAACALLAVGAVLSKENAASLPAALLLSEWVGFGWPRHGRAIWLGAVVMLLILTLPVVWKTAYWQPYVKGVSPSDVPLLGRMTDALLAPRSAPIPGSLPSPLDYLLTQTTVLPRYLGLAILPWGLNVDHDVAVASTLSGPVLAGSAFLAAVAALGLSQVRRRPFAAYAILWFFVTLSVESSVIPIDDVMAEHRMYLPMAGLALGAGWLFATAAARAPRRALVAGAVVGVGLVALTFARNVIWLSPLTLWVDAAEKSPDKARPHVNAGVAYHQADRLDEAVDQYCRALQLDGDNALARDNLEIALEALGKFHAMPAKVVSRAPDGTVTLEIDDVAAYCP